MSSQHAILVDVWSDYVCPFCYLELPAINRLQEEWRRESTALEVTWHAFELRPEPVPTLDPDGEYLHTVWNRSVYPMAAMHGMALRLPPVQPRSRQAFEAVFFAREQGHFDAMHLALFKAFFEDGKNIGDMTVLLDLASNLGLDQEELYQALQTQRHLPAVLEDEAMAGRLGVSGVPLTLLRQAGQPWASAVPLRGAVPYEDLMAAANAVASAR